MKSIAVSILLLCSLLSALAGAQTRRSLTNDDILKMVNLGFDESTIIKTIQANDANFDTSVEGLLALKNAGLAKNVIDAMLDAQAATNAKPDPYGGLPAAAGVYYRGDGGWTRLLDAPAPKTMSRGLLGTIASLGKTKTTYVYRGAHAPVQLREAHPVFYVRGVGKSGRDAEIVRLQSKAETREVERASDSPLWGTSGSTQNGTTLAVNVAHIADDALVITPIAPLGEGEYLFCLDADHYYDFGIVPGK